MFNKNVFTQKDPVADLAKDLLEAATKAKMEELKGQQHKIDKNKNQKIDAHDFAILRGEKKAVKEDAEQVEENAFDWKKPREPEVKGGSGVKKGRAYGGAAQKSKPEQDDADEKKMKKEEVDQIDELKTDTVHSYYKKAFAQKYAHKLGTGEKPSKETLRKRNQGMDRASKRFADKNPTKGAGTPASAGDWYKQGRYMGDSVEVNSENQLDERSLSAGETAEKERIVKGMKKNLAGFKKRYGEKAKSVMYATATKAAKKD